MAALHNFSSCAAKMAALHKSSSYADRMAAFHNYRTVITVLLLNLRETGPMALNGAQTMGRVNAGAVITVR